MGNISCTVSVKDGVTHRVQEEKNILNATKRIRLITLCVGTALYNNSLKERWKKLEDVGSYWMAARKREDMKF